MENCRKPILDNKEGSPPKAVLMEHEMEVNGKKIRQTKEVTAREGDPDKSVIVYTRSIDGRVHQVYKTEQFPEHGGAVETMISTVSTKPNEKEKNTKSDELENFEQEWSRLENLAINNAQETCKK